MAHDHQDKGLQPKVPTERPDPKAAARDPGPGAQDRPGFDLGGVKGDNKTGVGSTTIPGGPMGSPAQGTSATGRASGLTDLSGSRSLGNRAGAGSESGSGPTDGSGGPD